MKSPSFQFYPADWLSSASIISMTPAQEGAYIRLLAYAWLEPDCGLPLSHKVLSQMSRLGKHWGRNKDAILGNFREENGRLYNDRLLVERRKQEQWREKSRLGGLKSGSTRASTKRQPNTNHPSTVVSKRFEPNGNSSFSSSSSKEEPPIVPQGGQAFDLHAPSENSNGHHRAKSARRSRTGLPMTARFLTFYESYPKHIDKQEAWEEWQRLTEDEMAAAEEGLKRQLPGLLNLLAERGKEAPIWSPRRWLSKKKWTNDPDYNPLQARSGYRKFEELEDPFKL
jgi:hypothetical protein